MTQVNPRFWAKKKEDSSGRMYWLSLRDHLADTQAAIHLLWEHWLSLHQKQLVADSFAWEERMTLPRDGYEEGKKLAMFLAAVHDIGKAMPLFQTKRGFPCTAELDRILLERLEAAGFTKLSEFHVPTNVPHHTVAGENLLAYYGVGEDIYSVIGAHHGKSSDTKVGFTPVSGTFFPDNIDTIPRDFASHTAAYFQVGSLLDEDEAAKQLFRKWDQSQRDILAWALQSSGYQSADDLPQITKSGAVVLAGLVIMADWIASNEDYFPLLPMDEFADPMEEFVIEDRTSRVLTAWQRWKRSELWSVDSLPPCGELYRERFGFEMPRNAQLVFAQTVEQAVDPGIFIFEAPMGLGKTEVALAGAEILAYRKDMAGIYFGLPTQATSNGIFPRVISWLRRVGKASDVEDLSVRLVHGKASLNEDFANLAEQIDPDGNHGLVVNEWFAGRKKTSLDDFVVGTIDQLLLMALKQKHVFLRHLGFSKKVVIIDEVHAYDAYMGVYLKRALEWLGKYDVPVIVLSATLPTKRRKDLVSAYLKGKGIKGKHMVFDSQSESAAYPLITYSEKNHVRAQTEFAPISTQEVTVVRHSGDDWETLLTQLATEQGIIGVVVNTVRKAQALGKRMAELYGDAHVDILHSGFIDTERRYKEECLCRALGNHGERPKFRIIIGTQVIEQSLDIDFDVMVSDLAPMDLLLQRIGRLHRHSHERPAAYTQPQLHVLGINENYEFESGTNSIYDECILHRTQYFLPDVIRLPQDISPLVQKVYGDAPIETGEYTELYSWRKHNQENELERKEKCAEIYSLDKPLGKLNPTLIRFLENPNRQDMSEIRASAQVRDIEETIEVIAVKKVEDGYGTFIEGVDISSDVGRSQIARKLACETIRLPKILSKPYMIDKTIRELEEYNCKHLMKWQDNVWLKGTLGIIFDENHEFVLQGYRLRYDTLVGLQYERMEEDGEI